MTTFARSALDKINATMLAGPAVNGEGAIVPIATTVMRRFPRELR